VTNAAVGLPQYAVQHHSQTSPWSTDAPPRSAIKRTSPSIFSSVEELARGTSLSYTVTSPCSSFISGHVTSTPVQQRSASGLMPADLSSSSDTGYGDSVAVLRSRDDVIASGCCDVMISGSGDVITFGMDRGSTAVSSSSVSTVGDVIEMAADFRLSPDVAMSAAALLLPRRDSAFVSGSGYVPAASKSGQNEKPLQHPEDGGGEISALLSAAMATISPPPPQPQPAPPMNHSGFDKTRSPPQMMSLENSPQLLTHTTSSHAENKHQLIHEGFGPRKNPPLSTRDDADCSHEATPHVRSQLRPQNFGRSTGVGDEWNTY